MLWIKGRYPYRSEGTISKTLRCFPSSPVSPTRRKTGVSIPAEDKEKTSFLESGEGEVDRADRICYHATLIMKLYDFV